MIDKKQIDETADRLCRLYKEPFGGKPSGRFRISTKLVRQLMKRRRLYEDDVQNLARVMMERGYILIDMDSYFVVLSVNTFTNYRRANEDSTESV